MSVACSACNLTAGLRRLQLLAHLLDGYRHIQTFAVARGVRLGARNHGIELGGAIAKVFDLGIELGDSMPVNRVLQQPARIVSGILEGLALGLGL